MRRSLWSDPPEVVAAEKQAITFIASETGRAIQADPDHYSRQPGWRTLGSAPSDTRRLGNGWHLCPSPPPYSRLEGPQLLFIWSSEVRHDDGATVMVVPALLWRAS